MVKKGKWIIGYRWHEKWVRERQREDDERKQSFFFYSSALLIPKKQRQKSMKSKSWMCRSFSRIKSMNLQRFQFLFSFGVLIRGRKMKRNEKLKKRKKNTNALVRRMCHAHNNIMYICYRSDWSFSLCSSKRQHHGK